MSWVVLILLRDTPCSSYKSTSSPLVCGVETVPSTPLVPIVNVPSPTAV